MWPVVGLCLVAFLIIWTTHWIHKWRNPKCNGILPPGSMGLPLIGETLSILIPSRSLDVHPFFKKRIQKYGPIFRTSLAGRPLVVTADADINHFLTLQEGKLVEIWHFDTYAKVFNLEGEARTNAAGNFHRYLRSILLSRFGAERIKENLLPLIEGTVLKYLNNWSSQGSVEVQHSISIMFLNFIGKQLFSYDPDNPSEDISDKFDNFLKGFMSFPLNIPGTAYHKCMKNQKEICDILRNIIKKRRASPEMMARQDLLDQIIKDLNNEKFMNEESIVYVLLAVLFTSYESISSTITLALKLIADQPLVLEALEAEHEAILRNRSGNKESIITWDEYKSMTFTLQVINETLRLASHMPGILRRALKDIQVKGYTIPAGWTIMLAYSATLLNPDTYKDPLAFNPWRFKELESSVLSKNFVPFGGGSRQCAGAEFTRVCISVFLHVLVTKYKWTKIKGGSVVRNPLFEFEDGLHINISKKQK